MYLVDNLKVLRQRFLILGIFSIECILERRSDLLTSMETRGGQTELEFRDGERSYGYSGAGEKPSDEILSM